MPDTGERNEISARVNAKEAETVRESKKLVSNTKQRSAKPKAKNQRPRSETPASPRTHSGKTP